ncbi:uncharacterized protein LOC129859712 isoform X2 [Salvelinus fontinalis]|uniref:uncharacterized protein LOC129859712 isoform X2 n=1 Tax=Salvelinus fontinalis TaxID=8038 RepID=UPI002486844E|nr:uncharacterized protein LOC129859712 isoform X2 [Salvelinus fontinalis]
MTGPSHCMVYTVPAAFQLAFAFCCGGTFYWRSNCLDDWIVCPIQGTSHNGHEDPLEPHLSSGPYPKQGEDSPEPSRKVLIYTWDTAASGCSGHHRRMALEKDREEPLRKAKTAENGRSFSWEKVLAWGKKTAPSILRCLRALFTKPERVRTSSEGKDIINQRTELFLAIILKTNVSACNIVQSFLGWEFWRQRCPESTFKTHYSLGVTSSMLPELQQNIVCIGATAIPPYPTATGTSATGVRRTEWNQTEAGEEKFPRRLNHQTQTRPQPLRPPVHNPLSQTQTRPQPLRPPVHNPLSQTQTPTPKTSSDQPKP